MQGVLNIYGQTELGVVSVGISTHKLGFIMPGIVIKVTRAYLHNKF
jgi:hypothetical protein